MNKSLSALALVALVVCVLFGLSARKASAESYAHDMRVWFSDATIGPEDTVNGDVDVVFGDVTCEPGGWVRGAVRTYFGTFRQLDGCRVDGVQSGLGPDSVSWIAPWLPGDATTQALFEENRRITTLLVYGIVVVFAFLLFPVRVRVALERVERHPGLSAAVGTLAAVLVLPVAVLLVLSIIGIPLVVVEVAALCAAIWIGQAAVAILLGRRLFELLRPATTPSPLGALILGLVVVGAAGLLPGIGWVVTILVSLVGLGAAILAFVRESAFASTAHTDSTIGGTPMRSA